MISFCKSPPLLVNITFFHPNITFGIQTISWQHWLSFISLFPKQSNPLKSLSLKIKLGSKYLCLSAIFLFCKRSSLGTQRGWGREQGNRQTLKMNTPIRAVQGELQILVPFRGSKVSEFLREIVPL